MGRIINTLKKDALSFYCRTFCTGDSLVSAYRYNRAKLKKRLNKLDIGDLYKLENTLWDMRETYGASGFMHNLIEERLNQMDTVELAMFYAEDKIKEYQAKMFPSEKSLDAISNITGIIYLIASTLAIVVMPTIIIADEDWNIILKGFFWVAGWFIYLVFKHILSVIFEKLNPLITEIIMFILSATFLVFSIIALNSMYR